MSGEATAKCPENIVMPVILVPGIMGSRLFRRSDGRVVWDPTVSPKQVGGFLKTLWNARKNAAARRRDWVNVSGAGHGADYLDVYRGEPEGTIALGKRHERNWGGLVQAFYFDYMRRLDDDGAGAAAILRDDGVCLHTPSYAAPYNWTEDNRDSASKVAEAVTLATADAAKIAAGLPNCRIVKPLLITHSMGGLVGRAYISLSGGKGNIVGAIHVAMPTHGSPATYRRMLAGFEGASGIVLGINQAEVTSTAGNMPGALSLLPNKIFRRNDGGTEWLSIGASPMNSQKSYPAGDPFNRIYRNLTDWWRLIYAQFLDPDADAPGAAWDQYLDALERAEALHDQMTPSNQGFHDETRAIWSSSASKDHLCWDQITWTANSDATNSPVSYFYSSGRGTITFTDKPTGRGEDGGMSIATPVGQKLGETLDGVLGKLSAGSPKILSRATMSDKTAAGDATVNLGASLGLPGSVVTGFDERGFEHSACFAEPSVRETLAKWIAEMAQEG